MDYLVEGCTILKSHGLSDWKCKTSRSKTSWGHCDYGRRTIYLSKYLLQLGCHEEITQTILHEVAHALTPSDRGHGVEWLAKARDIGYSGYSVAGRVLPFKHRYIGTCSSGHKFCSVDLEKGIRCLTCTDRIMWYDRNEPQDVKEFLRRFDPLEFDKFEQTLDLVLDSRYDVLAKVIA